MSKIMKRQTSLNAAYRKRALVGWVAVVVGILIVIFLIYDAVNTPKRNRPTPGAKMGIAIVVGGLVIGIGVMLIVRGEKFRKGARGEKLVSETLTNFPNDWYIFNDVVIRDTQIDHLLVCPKGIYAIETKHYRGTISGDAEDPDWWQFIQSRQSRCYNPVRQTLHHAVSVAKYLRESGYSKVWVEPLVVFSHPEVKLKVTSLKVPVIYLSELSNLLNSHVTVMDSQECEEISTNLNNYLIANIKKSHLLTRWLPLSLITIAILGILWLVSIKKSAPYPEFSTVQKSPILWQDINNTQVGKKLTVQGKIVDIGKDDKSQAYFLNFSKKHDAFYVVIFKETSILSKLKKGDTICVTGQVSEYKGILQIKDPDKIEIK